MSGIFFDILEINIAAAIAITLLCIFADRLRRRYGAGWMKLAWMLLTVRMLIFYNFSIPGMEIRLLDHAGFEQEGFGWERGTALPAKQEDGAYTDEMMTAQPTERQNNGGEPESVPAEPGNPESGMMAAGDAQAAGGVSDTQRTGSGDDMAPDGRGNARVGAQEEQNRNRTAGAAGESREDPDAGQAGRSAFFYTRLLIIIWFAGVGAGFLYLAGSYLFVAGRYRRNLCPVRDTQLVRQIGMLQKRITGHAELIAYQSAAVAGPCLVGLIRPKLVLPADRSKWKEPEMELIMAHEMCHYRQKDLWLKMLMTAACCIHWFNPFIWLMKKQFFYDMELACDGSVLAGRDDDERENYARVMLAFAGGRKGVNAFSTGFGGSRKQMKARIDYILDSGIKKKGRLSIVITAMLVLITGIAVSCGYEQENDNREESSGMNVGSGPADEDAISNAEKSPHTGGSVEDSDTAERPSGEETSDFDYNHVYNDVIRGYQGDLYLAKKDGIYYIKGGQGEEQLLYANICERPKKMEVDGKNLYFSGSAPEEKTSTATVYRLDLDTHEVVDALAGFELKFPDYLITNVSVYEGNLYVALGAASTRIGFVLDEKGDAVSQLDEESPDFLYKEYNDYRETELSRLNAEYDTEEYWQLTEAGNGMYHAMIDVASCKKLLDGRQVVSRYKDESLISVCLENEDGTYEYLCDMPGFPVLVTESGIYYQDISMEIWCVDFETKQKDMFYRIDDRDERASSELSLVTYDADYIYLIQHRHIGDYYRNDGESVDKGTVSEDYLVRIPRAGGKAQKVYRFADSVSMYGDDGWYGHCGVYGGRMYFDNRESFSLDPDENGMQAVNSGEPCEDAVKIKETIRTFARAYFENNEETLRGLLAEDFEGKVEMYDYPEQADRIRETHVGGSGIPGINIDIGVHVYVYYEFTGWAEVEDNTVAYLSMSMVKTQDGFKIRWYGVEL